MERKESSINGQMKQGTFIGNKFKNLKRRFTKWILHTDLLYIFNKPRRMTKSYLKDIPTINENHILAGNYFIDKRMPITEKSIVYSLGISVDSSFDAYIANTYGCEVYMYDPTPISIGYMKKQKNSLFNFFPIAVWIENTTLKFSTPTFGGSSSSFINNDDDFFYAEARTVKTIMEDNGHTHIDVFKADIEGAALPIMLQMIEQGIIPQQIVIEFERYEREIPEVEEFFRKVSLIRDSLCKKGYEEFLLPREKYNYFSLELLFVKIKK